MQLSLTQYYGAKNDNVKQHSFTQPIYSLHILKSDLLTLGHIGLVWDGECVRERERIRRLESREVALVANFQTGAVHFASR